MGHCRKKMITLLMTNTCNLNCKYCYVEKNIGKIKTIDINFAKNGIKDYFQNNNSPAIRFFADGEPTLAFKEIKLLKDYAQSISNKKVIFEIQTNGCFNEEIRNWLAENMDIIFISLDGPPEINNKLRGNSDLVEDNLKFLAKFKNLTLGVRATITSLNNDKQIELINYLKELGVNILFVDLVFAKVGEETTDIGVDYKKFIDKYLEAYEYSKNKNFFYSTMFASNFDEEVECGCRACLPTPHLTVDGYVSCCDMCTSGNSSLNELIYGKFIEYENRIECYQEKIKNIKLRNKFNIPECIECEIKNYCAGACLGEALNETNNILGVKKETCLAIKYLWEKLGKKQIKLKYLHP